jgi:hypothetical protein
VEEARLLTIREAWLSYQRQVIPSNASDAQIVGSRFAFYAGAAVMFEMLSTVGEHVVSEDAGVAFIEALNQELRAFVAEQAREQETRES